MSVIEVTHLSKRYGQTMALDDVSLSFIKGEFFGLLGPSGSGKTSLLRALAGFLSLDSGSIHFDGELVENLPTHKRNIGMVFQNYALFPHMSVAQNIAFGLRVKSRNLPNLQAHIEEALELVRLQGFGARSPLSLSGGQQQRVALARALITKPRLLLLDEPLAALDRSLRQEMQLELKEIQRQVGITAIFVTHDQEEALSLSDRIGVLNQGKLIAVDTPRNLYERPKNLFVAQFLGDANIFANGHHIIRPEKIRLQQQGKISARIEHIIFSGPSVTFHLACEAFARGKLLVSAQNTHGLNYQSGDIVALDWNEADIIELAP